MNLIFNPIKWIFLFIFNIIILFLGLDFYLGLELDNILVDSIKSSSIPLIEENELKTQPKNFRERQNTLTSEQEKEILNL